MIKYLFIPRALEILLFNFQQQWLSEQTAYLCTTGVYKESIFVLGNSTILTQDKQPIPYSVTTQEGIVLSLIGFCVEAQSENIPTLPQEVLVFDSNIDYLNYVNRL